MLERTQQSVGPRNPEPCTLNPTPETQIGIAGSDHAEMLVPIDIDMVVCMRVKR